MTEQKPLLHEDARRPYTRRAPRHPENFQHFESEAQKQAHLDEVREKQQSNEVPF